MDIKVCFGLRVRELRKAKGTSQEGIAFDANIDRTYMNSVENGRRNISIKNIEKILKALDVSISEFFNSSYFQEMK
ncbi:MAG: helix-turn-helix transcriptional regulator [Bacteroidota bacterium]|nr:helix-turn-helix transcriptional regulator [Bacteroidota bacterium]MDP3432836.1 helix-turn-helix transcriptional regulator [Bacteroidota bacterium]